MICTMGALLVLLHAFARHGQIDLNEKAEARANVSREQLQAERETMQWKAEQLKQARDKTESQLAEERLKLSHVEDHERRLRERLEQLKAAVAVLETGGSTSDEREKALAKLEAAKTQLEEARKAVDESRRKVREAAKYSVVPYEGRHATERRPIYIECRDNSIVLQPEGIELLISKTLLGSPGPGNPLASALCGMREYYAGLAGPGNTWSPIRCCSCGPKVSKPIMPRARARFLGFRFWLRADWIRLGFEIPRRRRKARTAYSAGRE